MADQVEQVEETTTAPATSPDQAAELDDFLIDVSAPPVIADEPAITAEQAEANRLAGRERDEKGRLLPKKYEHDPLILEMASEFGITADEAASMKPDEMSATVRRMRRFAATTRRDEPQQTPGPRQQIETPVEEPIDLGIDESAYDPAFVALMKNQIKEKRDLQKKLDQITGHLQQQSQQQMYNEATRVFEALPSVFGAGVVEPGTAEFAKRRATWQEAADDKSNLPFAQKIKIAAVKLGYAATGKTQKPANPYAEEQIAADTKRWNDAALGLPSNRTGASDAIPLGPKKAAASVAAKMEAWAKEASGAGTEQDILDGFPD